ncbi:MAG TPA: hypothetical protein VJZ98_05670 [Actinomycetota bacterium]|nr:hypothetical protein [Actinomycetota bacterium]
MLAAEGFELVFRTLHIMAGVAWAGSAFLFTVFIEPAAAKLGPAGRPVHGGDDRPTEGPRDHHVDRRRGP